MPSLARKNYWTFGAGFVTEASRLTFPDGATQDERNMTLRRDGSRYRRKGMQTLATVHNTGVTVDADWKTTLHVWEFPENIPDLAILVFQLGPHLAFFNATTLAHEATLDLRTQAGLSAFSGDYRLDMESTNGVLVCVAKDANQPFYVKRAGAGSYSATVYFLFVRDTWGVFDLDVNGEAGPVTSELPLDFRPAVLTAYHQYNTINQGWATDPPQMGVNGVTTLSNFWNMNIYSVGGDWPSNADIVYLGRSVNAADGVYGSFQPDLVRRAYLGTTPAPKGKVILDIFNRGNNRITASNLIVGKVPDPQLIADITGLIPADLELGRPTNVSFYAGRIFYSGITSQITGADPRSPLLTGAVMYSQLLENLDKLGKCYQEADPTSEEISDLVATDGGIIFIPGAANIVEQTPIGNSLIIFAQTGIWAIQGSEAGFAADDFQVKKVSDIGVLEHESIIPLESGVVFWAQNGVYALSLDAGLGSYAVQSLSREKIQTYYNDIPVLAKRNARGYFDAQSQVLMWLFNPNAGPADPQNEYTHELRFDLTLQAWYLYEYAQTETSPKITDYASSTLIDQLALTGVAEPVYAVLEDGATYRINFSSLADNDLQDWGSINYSSYLRFGSELVGNGFDQKTEMTTKFYFNRTEVEYDSGLELFKQSSAQLTAFWNFSDASSSDAKHGPVEVYKLQRYTSVDTLAPDTPFEYGRDVVMTQERVRGRGMAVDLLLESDGNKDMQLLGWTAQFMTDGPELNG